MRTAWLHIGWPKAGSSSLQISLAGLRAQGLRYAALNRNPNHGSFLLAAMPGRDGSPANHAYQDRLHAEITANADDMIFSAEVLNTRPWLAGDLEAFLLRAFDRVRVICTVRDVASHMPAIALHAIPQSVLPLRGWVRSGGEDALPLPYVEPRLTAEWIGQLRDTRLRLMDFADCCESGPGNAMLRAIGRDDLHVRNVHLNSSPSAQAVSLLLHFIGEQPEAMMQFVPFLHQTLLRDYPGHRLAFDAELIAPAIDQNRDALSLLEGALGRSLIDLPASPEGMLVSDPADLLDAAIGQRQALGEFLTGHWKLPPDVRDGTRLSDMLAAACQHIETNGGLLRPPDWFSPDEYLRLNPDVRASGVEARRHFMRHGIFEKRFLRDRARRR